jgi:Fic family protein
MSLRQELQEKKNLLESMAGKDYLTKELKDYFHAELIFISSNIEKVVVSREEAKDIVAQYPNFKPIPASNMPLLQAKGQKIALEYAEDMAHGDQPITADTVRTIHRMVFDQVAPEMAGQYREERINIEGTKFMPTIHYFIPGEMREFDARLLQGLPSTDTSVWDILDFATWAHYEVVRIHPFKDGNGRVARILFNLICRRYDLPYVLVPKSGTENRM